MKVKLRMDDLDPRIKLEELKPLHKEFVKRKIPFTVAVNNIMGNIYKFNDDVLDYINSTDPKSWDIQLHGLEHDKIWAMQESHVYRDVFCNLEMTKKDFIHSNPKIYYPAWNQTCIFLEQACKKLGLEVHIATRTIREFLINWGTYQTYLYYWHWWTPDDVKILPDVLDKMLEVNKKL